MIRRTICAFTLILGFSLALSTSGCSENRDELMRKGDQLIEEGEQIRAQGTHEDNDEMVREGQEKMNKGHEMRQRALKMGAR